MGRLFESYVMVDWSAASKPKTGPDSIWIGALTPDARFNLQYKSINPDTRQKAFELISAAVDRLVKRGDRVLLGFDFSMGYPVGTASKLNLSGTDQAAWANMHNFLAKELKDKPTNANNRFALAARMNRIMSGEAFPFWGCPKKDVITTLSDKKPRPHGADDPAEYRLAEKRAAEQKLGRPQTVWKLGYAGAVGGQSFTGIPVVQKLRHHFEDTSTIWPFETGWLETEHELPQVTIAEIYPSIIELKAEKGRVRDDLQVESLARYFAEIDSKEKFFPKFGRPEGLDDTESSQILTEEGWILGV